MKLDKFINNKIQILILIILIAFGFYLCSIGGYGSDEDTLPLIGAFESMMGGSKVMASRFTPYPVAEIGIGFLSYQLGSWAANFVTFVFIIIGNGSKRPVWTDHFLHSSFNYFNIFFICNIFICNIFIVNRYIRNPVFY